MRCREPDVDVAAGGVRGVRATIPEGVEWQEFYASMALLVKTEGIQLLGGTDSAGPRAVALGLPSPPPLKAIVEQYLADFGKRDVAAAITQ
jgi:hypothetical protein